MAFLNKSPWFIFAHTKIGGGASFASLNKRIKIWWSSTSTTFKHIFERCCHSLEGFIEMLRRDPREREARYLLFTIQRPGSLIFIPHLLAHAVLTLDTRSPAFLSKWDAAITTSQQIFVQTLDEYTFGVRRGKWCEIFCSKVCLLYGSGCFLLRQALKKVKKSYKNTGIFRKSTVLVCYCPYTSRRRFPVRSKVIASPLYSHLTSVARIKGLLIQGPPR